MIKFEQDQIVWICFPELSLQFLIPFDDFIIVNLQFANNPLEVAEYLVKVVVGLADVANVGIVVLFKSLFQV